MPNATVKIIKAITVRRLILLFLLLILPTIFAPYHSDDFFQLLLLSGHSAIERSDASLWGLFSFVDEVPEHRRQMLQYGVLPWFAADDFHFRFLRPLAEITHWLDVYWFGVNPLPAHIQSVIWFGMLSVVIYQLATRIFPAQAGLPLLALAIFLLDGQHVATIGWIANRNALLAAFFGFAALLSHFVWMETHEKRYFVIALCALALALLSGEAALAMVSYLFFYAVFIDDEGFKKGLPKIIPYFCLVAIWFYFYQYFDFGVSTSAGLYLNPFTDTVEYLTAIIYRIPIYFTAAILPIPAGLSWGGGIDHKWLSVLFYAVSLMVVLVFCFLFRKSVRANKRILYCIVAATFSLFPVCATMAQDRLSLFQTVGMDIAIAALILECLRNADFSAGKYNAHIASVLVTIHLILSPLHLLLGSAYMHWGAKKIQENALSLSSAAIMHKEIICFQVPIGEAVSLMGIREVAGAGNPDGFFWLSNDEGKMVVAVLDSHDVSIEKSSGFANGFESAFRSVKKRPFYVGELIGIPAGTIEIRNINQQHYPDKIIVHFNRPLADKSLLFYTYSDGMYRQVVLPEIGKTMTLE